MSEISIRPHDPELVKQLNAATLNENPVEAVVRLKPEVAAQIVPQPEQTERLTSQLLKRVEEQSGKVALRYNVFRNLGSFVVSAHPAFIRELMSQPEVASIVANQQPGEALIPPIKKNSPPVAKQKKPSLKQGNRVRSTSGSKKARRSSPK